MHTRALEDRLCICVQDLYDTFSDMPVTLYKPSFEKSVNVS